MRSVILNLSFGIIISVLTIECSSTQIIKLNEELSITKQARLITKAEERIEVYNVFASQDSIFALDLTTHNKLYYHRNEIDRIIGIDRLKGALHGAFFGALGTAGGTLLGSIIIGVVTDNDFFIGYAPLFAVFGSVYGILLGPIPGSIIGSKNYYIFESDSTNPTELDSLDLTMQTQISDIKKNNSDISNIVWQSSFSQGTRSRPPKHPTEPNNQIAFSVYGTPGGNDKIELIGVHYRRFLGNPATYGRYYINYSHNFFSGRGEESAGVYHWDGSAIFLSMGSEIFRSGVTHKGFTGFGEVGITKGIYYSRTEAGSWSGKPGVDRDGYGFVSGVGVRGWWNLLFGEVQISYDTWTEYIVPRLVVGYRF